MDNEFQRKPAAVAGTGLQTHGRYFSITILVFELMGEFLLGLQTWYTPGHHFVKHGDPPLDFNDRLGNLLLFCFKLVQCAQGDRR